jgi:hypothetical protein
LYLAYLSAYADKYENKERAYPITDESGKACQKKHLTLLGLFVKIKKGKFIRLTKRQNNRCGGV